LAKLGFIEIGKTGKFFNVKSKVEVQNLFMFSGYKTTFTYLEKGLFFKIDSAKKIVRNETVLEHIQAIYKKYGDRDK